MALPEIILLELPSSTYFFKVDDRAKRGMSINVALVSILLALNVYLSSV